MLPVSADLFGLGALVAEEKPKKRRQLTAAQKAWAWDNHPKTCNICGKRVTKFSEAEWDHARAYANGGATNMGNVKIAHRACNRIKGKKTLSETKRLLGIKPKKTKKKRAARRAPSDPFGLGDLGKMFRL